MAATRDKAAKRRTMAILATLRQSGGINALARQLDQPPAAIMAATNSLLPALVERFRQCSGGMPELLRLIEESGGAAMAQALMSEGKVDVQPGVMLLARIGNEAAISGDSSVETMLAPDIEARLMTLLAMLLGGYLSARSATGGLNSQELTELLDARKSFYSSGDESV